MRHTTRRLLQERGLFVGTWLLSLLSAFQKTPQTPLCEGHWAPREGFNFVLCSPSSKVDFCLAGEKVLGLARSTSLVTLSLKLLSEGGIQGQTHHPIF